LGGDLFLVVGGSADAQAFLLRVCSEVVAHGGDGRSLVRALAGHATTRGDEMPPCAALAPSGSNLVVFLHGEAQAESGELFKLSGRESLAWVDRVVPWPLGTVTISLTGAREVDEGAYNLRDGAVPGAGLTLITVDEGSDTAPDVPIVPPSAEVVLPPEPVREAARAREPEPVFDPGQEWDHDHVYEPVLEHATSAGDAAPAQPPPTDEWMPPAKRETPAEPSPAPPTAWESVPAPSGGDRPRAADLEPQSFESVIIGFPDHGDASADAFDDEPMPEREPLPIAGERQLREHADERPQVRGVYCKNNHFNDARQLFCAVCGINMVQQTPILTSGPRPPLGVLVLDDGSVFQLDDEYVIGREPTSDESVASGRRRALVVDDDYKTVSRAHARIELHDWDAVLFDNGSANGTFAAAEGETTWQHVPPGQPYVLRAGARVLIGRRTMIYNTHRAS
jgi:hypothetical protein